MKPHSDYLNPFQPFTERESGDDADEQLSYAIEDNMSRSVLSALANAQSTLALERFLNVLAQEEDVSLVLRNHIENLAKMLRSVKHNNIECHLQCWPAAAMKERDNLKVLLIGISSDHESDWTHNQRVAPQYPKPDAWIYIPGQMLLVFEFKTDEHPLDATQISAYAHSLKLLPENDDVPKADAGQTLVSAKDAKKVQDACGNLVLDASWPTVVKALNIIQQEGCINTIERWLCGQAADYVKLHIFPPYRGIQTILDWLQKDDTSDNRYHLRALVRQLGDDLAKSKNNKDTITFACKGKDENNWDLKPGAGSAVYVKLKQQDGPLLQRSLDLVLWFQFVKDKSKQIGLQYYIQAQGSQIGKDKSENAWNSASKRHLDKASKFENKVKNWIEQKSPNCLMSVSTVRFNGKKKNWQGGGKEDPETLSSPIITPIEALKFLEINKNTLWCFPRVGHGETFSKIEDAACLVCKPALSLLAPLDSNKLAAIGKDVPTLQEYLIEAVKNITSQTDYKALCSVKTVQDKLPEENPPI